MSAIAFSNSRSFPVEVTPLPRMPAILLMLAVTAAYLAIELPFATALVDIFGLAPTLDEIHRMETTGRVVSGLALALVVWGMKVPKWHEERPWLGVAFMMALTGAICVVAMSLAQRALIDTIVDKSTPEARQMAVRALVVREHMNNGLRGANPSEAALMGLNGYMAWADPNSLSRLADPDAAIARYAFATVPDLEKFSRDVYRPLVDAMREAFPEYQKGVKSWQEARDRAPQMVEQSWQSYQRDLRKRGVRQFTPDIARQIRSHLAKKSIYVAHDWHPADRAGFDVAAWKSHMSVPNARFDGAVNRMLGNGDPVPKNLTRFEDFWTSDAIQGRIKAKLQVPNLKERIPLAYSNDAIKTSVLPLLRKDAVETTRRATLGSPASFRDGGTSEIVGRDAVRVVVGPLLALAFSALGALVHLVKLTNYGFMAIEKGKPSRMMRTIRIGAIATVAGTLIAVATPLPEHSKSIEAATTSDAAAMALKWVVGTHRVVHPLGEALSVVPLLPMLESGIDAIPQARM